MSPNTDARNLQIAERLAVLEQISKDTQRMMIDKGLQQEKANAKLHQDIQQVVKRLDVYLDRARGDNKELETRIIKQVEDVYITSTDAVKLIEKGNAETLNKVAKVLKWVSGVGVAILAGAAWLIEQGGIN